MKTTLALIILITSTLFVGSALAQTDDTGPALEEPAEPAPALDTAPVATGSEEAAPAAVEAAAPDKPLEQGKGLYKSVKGGEWLLAFGFLGMILGSIARFTIGKKWKFLTSKAGGYTIAGFTGVGILGTLIVEAGAFSMSMLTPAILATTAAMAMHGPAKAIKNKLVGPATEA